MRTETVMKGLLATTLSVALIVGVILARPAIAQDDLPDAPGKTILMTSCNTACHSASQVAGERQTADQWNSTIVMMMNNGAVVPDDQIGTLVAYLANNFGPQGQPNASTTTPVSGGTGTLQDSQASH